MSLFFPDATFRSYREITAEVLKNKGISILLLDIDNTLAPYEQPDPDTQITEWLNTLAAAGIRTAFLSNNHAERVERFNKLLARPVRYNAHKPLPRQAKRLIRALGGAKSEAAFLGDQIFTDVLCAHLCGARGFLVPPIKDRTDGGTRFKRRLERNILKRYYKKHPHAPDVREGSPLTAEFEKRNTSGG